MAKQRSQRSVQRAEKRAAEKQQRIEAQRAAQESMKRPYTLIDSMKLGRLANILFVVFIIVCLIYYYSLARKGDYVFIFDVVAYAIEIIAFVTFTISVVWMDKLVRARALMKFLMILYICVEVILMLLEFDLLPFNGYDGLSMWLVIGHSIFSGAVSFSLLMLDASNRKMERIVLVTSSIMLAGMFFGYFGYRVYASILLNAFAYIIFYTAMLHQLRMEEIRVDCYGDNAEEQAFTSTMFSDVPTMVEKPVREKETISQKAKRAANLLNLENTERTVLTDKEEKFEYEFGVIEDDEDDDDEDGGLT